MQGREPGERDGETQTKTKIEREGISMGCERQTGRDGVTGLDVQPSPEGETRI